jgi:hypothetical protein
MEKRAVPYRTICETIREIYDIAGVVKEEDLREEIKARLYIIFDMAKRMNKKLREYKHNWDEGWWEANADYEKDLKRREKRNEHPD